jgi:hypothetical protein
MERPTVGQAIRDADGNFWIVKNCPTEPELDGSWRCDVRPPLRFELEQLDPVRAYTDIRNNRGK